jgi:glycerate dehydrogenase
MKDLVILDGYTLNPGDLSWEPLERIVDSLVVYDRTPDELIVERIGQNSLALTNKTPFVRATLESLPHNLKYIGILATGYDLVDWKAASEKGITVTNIPGYGTMAVAQFTIALLLELAGRIGHHDAAIRAGKWKDTPDWCFWDYPLVELSGKTMGIIGYGAIGRAVAKIASSLGMRILAYNGDKPPLKEDADAPFVNFTELLHASDVISLHAPLTPETEGIINRASISGMKSGVMIINTARGGLIVEKDLTDALESGKVSGAALDVLSSEPPTDDAPILRAKNCILTPHIAWAPQETRERLIHMAADNLLSYFSGTPTNVVPGKGRTRA